MEQFNEIMYKEVRGQVFFELSGNYDPQTVRTGEVELAEPIRAKISEGKKLLDLVRLQDPLNFTLSEQAFARLKMANLTGWKGRAMEIEGLDKKYHLFQGIGKCGPLKRPAKAGFVKGMEFDLATWDGSDFFIPSETGTLFCTEKAMQCFRDLKLNNVEINALPDITWYST